MKDETDDSSLSFTLLVAVLVALGPYIGEHDADDMRFDFVEELARVAGAVAPRASCAEDEQHAIDLGRQHRGIRDRIDRRGIEEDHVGMLLERRDHGFHAPRPENIGGPWWQRTTGKQH